jgi:hypothetical protein
MGPLGHLGRGQAVVNGGMCVYRLTCLFGGADRLGCAFDIILLRDTGLIGLCQLLYICRRQAGRQALSRADEGWVQGQAWELGGADW